MRLLSVLAILLIASGAVAQSSPPRNFVQISEDEWVVFYDVASRRFREVRANFIRQDFERAAADLRSSAIFLDIEADRAQPAIAERLAEVSSKLQSIADNIDSPDVTGADLDTQFARAHWLLAQHYLAEARKARDGRQLKSAGLLLFATTHHIERAVLWSNTRIDRRLQATLDSLRELAIRLQDHDEAGKAIGEKPIAKAEALLGEIGAVIDRPVVLTTK